MLFHLMINENINNKIVSFCKTEIYNFFFCGHENKKLDERGNT